MGLHLSNWPLTYGRRKSKPLGLAVAPNPSSGRIRVKTHE